MPEVAIINGQAMTREQYGNYLSHLGSRRHLAPAFNPIQPAAPAAPAPAPTVPAPNLPSIPQPAPTPVPTRNQAIVNVVQQRASVSDTLISPLAPSGIVKQNPIGAGASGGRLGGVSRRRRSLSNLEDEADESIFSLNRIS